MHETTDALLNGDVSNTDIAESLQDVIDKIGIENISPESLGEICGELSSGFDSIENLQGEAGSFQSSMEEFLSGKESFDMDAYNNAFVDTNDLLHEQGKEFTPPTGDDGCGIDYEAQASLDWIISPMVCMLIQKAILLICHTSIERHKSVLQDSRESFPVKSETRKTNQSPTITESNKDA